MTTPKMNVVVEHWQSHPDNGNQWLFASQRFYSLEDAKASEVYQAASLDIEWIRLDSPEFHETRRNPSLSLTEVIVNKMPECKEKHAVFFCSRSRSFNM